MSSLEVEVRGGCTVAQLTEILTADGGIMMLPSRPFDEITPGLFIGEEAIARSPANLTHIGVTHVLNAAEGADDNYHVTADKEIYRPAGIKYKGVEASDDTKFDLSKHFNDCADYIAEAMEGGGKVMVFCKVGSSRSAAIVLAFLMLKRHYTAPEAVKRVRSRREICPNDGFLQQLCDLNGTLKSIGHFDKKRPQSTNL